MYMVIQAQESISNPRSEIGEVTGTAAAAVEVVAAMQTSLHWRHIATLIINALKSWIACSD